MRIAFLVGQFPALSQTFVLNQITGLLDRGHDVTIYASCAGSERTRQPDIDKYDLLRRTRYRQMPTNRLWRVLKACILGIRWFPKKPLAILRSLNAFRFGKTALSLKLLYAAVPFLESPPCDIVHCHFGPNGTLAVLLRQAGVVSGKIVTTFHGYDTRLGMEKGTGLYSLLAKEGDLFIAINQYNHDRLIEFGMPMEKIARHPVGIPLDKFPFRKPRASSTHERRTIRILTVARLVGVKGLKYGIAAVYQVARQLPSYEISYTIVGDGYTKKNLEQLVNTLGLTASVCFVGAAAYDGVLVALQNSDIFLLPSVRECFGTVLLEAQAVGLPIVATNVGGVHEAIVDGQSGFLVESCDPNALANRLTYLVEHQEAWAQMCQAGREHIAEHFDIELLNDRLVELYRVVASAESADSAQPP